MNQSWIVQRKLNPEEGGSSGDDWSHGRVQVGIFGTEELAIAAVNKLVEANRAVAFSDIEVIIGEIVPVRLGLGRPSPGPYVPPVVDEASNGKRKPGRPVGS